MKEKLILSGCLLLNKDKELLLLKRKDHGHYETPGGKVETEGQIDLQVLRETVERELKEEVGSEFEIDSLRFFSNVLFTTPDGKKAIANKFTANLISGEPKINEPELFSELVWLPIDKLESVNLSPDLKIIAPLIKERL
ncbi:NUDIX domain-containing protein [Candidatus Micrarchaeota archaeon]|jgi:8-oxo-dGTP pyrophosphatase MutT (NUDIX family)|nr:NUDIX domain-containing protein [Candidatus Micrarchaeota archaeon]